MRRFIAYLLASITIFLGIGFAFRPVVTSINADLDYREGREITFRLTDHKDTASGEDPIENKATYYANVMETRLVGLGVSDYKITTSGEDIVKVTLTTSNTDECDHIAKLLCTNPEIEICNLPKEDSDPEKAVKEIPVVDSEDGKYSWHDGKAYLTYNGNSTTVVMPIPSEARKTAEDMFEAAKKYEEEEPKPDPTNSRTNDEEKQSIVLWMDRGEDDEYKNKDNPDVAKKIIYDKFNTSNFYYGDKKDAFQIVFTPAGKDEKSIRDSFNEANLLLNLLNASETPISCEKINVEIVPAAVESLLVYGSRVGVAMSATLISIIVGFVIISLILTCFYRLSAVAIVTTMSAHVFLTFVVFTFFRSVFNISAMLALLVTALISLASSIAHNNYLREELYKGRNLKKANYEASKKTTMLTVDASVISIILGIVLYFLGGAGVASAGVILVLGSVLNIVINTFLLKGLMWLLTNNTAFQDKSKYSLFNVDIKKIPDLSKEEKPTYYGPFINKDYTKHKKVSGIIVSVLAIASVVGLIIFGVNGKIFNSDSFYAVTNEAMFAIRADSGEGHPSIDDVRSKLDLIMRDGKEFKDNIGEITYFEFTAVREGSQVDKPIIDTYQTYKISILVSDISGTNFSVKDATNLSLTEALKEILEKEYHIDDDEGLMPPHAYSNVTYNIPNNVGMIVASTFISLAATSAYLLLRRFRASRVLPLLITSAVGTTLSIGFIALTRVIATPAMGVTSIFTMVMTTLMALFIMHKDKELIRDERLRNIETRQVVLKKANALALLPMLIFALISVFAAINFFGFGNKEYLALFFSSAFGTAASVAILLTWFLPMANFFEERFSLIKLPEIKLRKKARIKVKSNEPEEAVFIGIND